MNRSEYLKMYQLESTYWWYTARRKLLLWGIWTNLNGCVDPKILDVGCGTGLNATALNRYGTVTGVDLSPEALAFCRSRGLEDLQHCSAEHLPLKSATFDIITALDVLEHVDDDNQVLRELLRVLRPGGLLFITAPAYGFLWSEHDEALHHRRRYSAHELRNKLTAANLEVHRITYFITLLFFPILLMRIFQNLFKKSVEPKTSHILLPSWLNAVLVALLGFERILLRFMNLPFGVSVVAWARKPATASVPLDEEELETAEQVTSANCLPC